MFLSENFFRLFSVGLLGILFVSVSAMAEKEKKEPLNILSAVSHAEEAEMINKGELHVLNLTSIGERIEIITPSEKQK